MKILIVDDEPLIRKSLSRLLIQRGYQIVEADNGRDAVRIWKNETPDLVLLDFMMPGLNGLEVLKEVDPKLKKNVIIMSAYVGSNEHKDFSELGATYFFPKPFDDIFQMIDKIEDILNK